MDARTFRAVALAAVLLVSMGARHPSANFIVEAPSPQLSQQIAQAAEKYRHDLAVEWLGQAMPNWAQPCVMTVHVGPHLGAGGATTFVFDRGEVFGWRMTIQGSTERVLDSVLPHEITHMIFASHFRRPLPRWADEGGATSVECVAERNKHQQMLQQFLRSGRGIAFSQMFAMKEYPPDVMPLYAQGYSLAEFLIQAGGRRKYIAFLGDGLEGGDWAGAIRKHYGMADLGGLQNTWLAWVRQGSPSLKTPQDQPVAKPSGEMLAAATRRPRPQPNLIHYEPKASPLAPLVPVASVAAPGSFSDVVGGTGSLSARAGHALASSPSPRAAPQTLPAAGWHAVGTPAPRLPAAAFAAAAPAAANPTAPAVPPGFGAPLRLQLTHPQPIEPPRQIVLEWERK